MQEYNWAQEKLNAVTGTEQAQRHEAQLAQVQHAFRNENRAQRRERERQERRATKRMVRA